MHQQGPTSRQEATTRGQKEEKQQTTGATGQTKRAQQRCRGDDHGTEHDGDCPRGGNADDVVEPYDADE
jgi:hypothetical protein